MTKGNVEDGHAVSLLECFQYINDVKGLIGPAEVSFDFQSPTQ